MEKYGPLPESVQASHAVPRSARDCYARLCSATIMLAINDGAKNLFRSNQTEKAHIESALWFLFHPDSHIHLMAEYLNMNQEQITHWVMSNEKNYKLRSLRINALNVGGREQLLTWKYHETQRRTNH